ncbi:D-alanyl-D-alanine carboxypeptidase family protein [Iamia majanohamensis]|uniref:D-alanyl-D-alanine carboxypeptidase family protein n=1 Tax=Iamia majanohamensis TaxID=467976 RepID=A0AAE9YCP1_9ACTN|nr:D-alanyl-D-alanine carboxypeptidase family protein [Iamia majanohamensis]WCO68624.1 D-alanyl-D-alanine carboxypeptidase family protein [Iamia majanohamensis]
MHRFSGALGTLLIATVLAATTAAPTAGQTGPAAPDPAPTTSTPTGAGAEERAAAEGYVAQLEALNRDLEALDADIEAARDRQAELADEADRLDEEAADTRAAVADARTRITTLETILRERIAGTYMADRTAVDIPNPQVDASLIRRIYAEARSVTDDRLLDQLDDQRARLEHEHEDLAALEAANDAQAEELDDLLAGLRDQQAERTETAIELQRAIQEAQRQAWMEAAAAKARAEEAAERARLAQIAAQEAAAQRAADLRAFLDAAREAEEEAQEAAREAGSLEVGTSLAPGGIDLCTVAGITVNCLIADQLGEMVLHAATDGVVLTGFGYRSTAEQMALRAAHCDGDVFGRPASACSPPTARPGSSLHEVGLAIDFDRCSTRATACFRWLDEHAAEHGFKNLPSEPWHWSTSGG